MIIKDKIKVFLLSFSFIRLMRFFFYNKIFPFFKYSCYFLLILIIVGSVGFVVFKKDDYRQLKNNIIKYSANLINLNSTGYTRINISGNKYTDYEDIAAIVRDEAQKPEDDNADNSYVLMIKQIKKKIKALPWVDQVIVTRSLPNSLNITINEYWPFAVWQDQDNKYIINKDGKIIEIDNIRQFYDLLILAGKNANFHVESLFNILTIDSGISKDIYYAAWIGDRRWNIKFNNGLLIKLPADNMSNAWDKLIELYNIPGSLIDLKMIDLRNSSKIYLEYGGQSIKEIRSL